MFASGSASPPSPSSALPSLYDLLPWCWLLHPAYSSGTFRSPNFNLRRAVLRRGEGAVLHQQESTRFSPVGDEWEQARKTLKHVSDPDHQLESKRRRLVGEESCAEGSPSDDRHDPYVRSATALFKLLDKDYLQRSEQATRLGTEPSFILRFLQPAKLTATGGRIYSAMPELHDGLLFQNGVGPLDGVEDSLHLGSPESDQSMKWDPTRLLSEKLYKVDWNPLVEKRSRFRNMEGHLEVPNLDGNIVPEVEPEWKKLYFRTSMGRFQWFASHCADEHPIGDVLLTGTTVTTNRDEWTIEVRGGKESANIRVRVPSQCWDKWLQALLSHSNSKLIDAYVQPVFPAVPHYTERVVLVDLGMCSVRAGLLTNRPALPQSFFPAVGCVMPTGEVHVGVNAFKPEVRQHGLLQSPIQSASSANPIERYKLNKQVLEAVLAKIVADLRVDPTQYKVLLSIPQNVPTVFVGDLLRMLINQFNFKAASVTRHPSLILYSYDVTSGVVVDIGERLNIVPVIDEFIVDSGVISLPFGAQQIRDSLRQKLAAQNGGVGLLSSAVEQVFLRHILEQACYVATDYDSEQAKGGAEEVKVNFDRFKIGPGMEPVTFVVDGATRFQSTEGLFQPKKWGLEIKGIAKLIHDSIQLSPIDSRRTLYRNVYLSGGTSLLPGLAERLETELCKIAPSSIFVQVHGSPWRYHSAYLGAHIIANSHQFESCCADAANLDKYIKQMESYTN